jgi:hypothetical protein
VITLEAMWQYGMGYLHVHTPPCDSLDEHTEMKMPLDKILTDIIFAETAIKVECDMVARYGCQCLQTPPLNLLMYSEIMMSSNKILTDKTAVLLHAIKTEHVPATWYGYNAYADFIL